MKPCDEMDGLLAERALGGLALEDQALLDAHLPGCQRCRAGLASYEVTFGLMREAQSGPSPSSAASLPERGSSDLASSTLAVWARRRRRRVAGLVLGAGFLPVAATLALALAPSLFARRAAPPAPETAPAAVWEPDVDGAVEATLQQGEEITSEDVALAALDAAEPP